MKEIDKLIKGFMKEKLIKSQIKEAINKYSDAEKLVNEIKEIFLNNSNYNELINLKQSIFLPNISANFYFKDNKVQASYSSLSITLNNKFNTMFFDKKNKDKVLSKIENILIEKDLLKENIWSFVKLKDLFLLVRVVGPNTKDIPEEVRNCIKENSVVMRTLLPEYLWDATKF